MIYKLETIKKGTKIYTNHLGIITRATALESIKQGRGLKKTLFVDVKGAEVGLFDEMGSIYVKNIVGID